MKEVFRLVVRVLLYILGAILVGFGLLVSVYMLPTTRIRQNIAISSEQISEEDTYYQWAKGYKNAQSDTYTDASLYLNAMYPGENTISEAIVNALNVPRLIYGDDNNEASAVLFANDQPGELQEIQYGRYWHGSLVLLKPLLMLFDLGDMRIFEMMIQLTLMVMIIIGLVQKGKTNVVWAFLVMVILLNPITMVMGFCFSVEYVLMLIMANIVLYFHKQLLVNRRYYFFFLINGILFDYFNELSFPMIGLGIPLVMYLILSQENVKTMVKREILFSIAWGVGYVSMWVGKWILAWIFTGYNYVAEAVHQAQRYISENATWEVNNPSVLDRLMKNINVYMKWPYFFLGLITLAFVVFYLLKVKNKNWRKMVYYMLPYLLPIIMPFIIFIAIGNGYSYVHYWFTHRLLAISVFAGICMLVQNWERLECNKSKGENNGKK